MRAYTRRRVLLTLVLSLCILTGCGGSAEDPPERDDLPAQNGLIADQDAAPSQEDPEETEDMTMTLNIGDHSFTILLADNETAAALLERLPLELDMSELNGNEKYHYLPFHLPTDVYSPGQIQAGDVMLYGDDCLVVFYASFSTPYRYTRIGRIEDTAGLREAVGSGGVQMSFSAGA